MPKSNFNEHQYGRSQYDSDLLCYLLEKRPGVSDVNQTSQWEDKVHHVDITYSLNGRSVKVDVKGYKGNGIRRDKDGPIYEKDFDYESVWLERYNTSGDGWIVPREGGPDYIAFRAPAYFIFVKPEHLLGLWKKKISGDSKFVETKPKDYYVPYKRKDYDDYHKDLTAMFKMSDLAELINEKKAFCLEY